MGHNRALGAHGEARAARWYEAQGFEVLDRNWRCRDGELDLVARRGDLVVICEVKTRTSDAFGHPEAAVGHAKRKRIRRLAARYLAETGRHSGEVRFDVVAITGPNVEVFEDAF